MAKKTKAAKPAIPAALAQKLSRTGSSRAVAQRNAQAPRGGHSPRPIRHQGR
jgi:hypothetical protein